MERVDASGLNHNVCDVIPEWKMVIIRMGVDGNPAFGKHNVYNGFIAKLREAMLASPVKCLPETVGEEHVAAHRTVIYRNRPAWPQFSLRVLIEMATVCCVIAAAQQLDRFLGIALSFGVVAAWAIRVPDWQMQFSLVMLFGGMSGVLLGCYFVAEGFRLIPQVLDENRWPERFMIMGPLFVVMGAFWAAFGLVHLMFVCASGNSTRQRS